MEKRSYKNVKISSLRKTACLAVSVIFFVTQVVCIGHTEPISSQSYLGEGRSDLGHMSGGNDDNLNSIYCEGGGCVAPQAAPETINITPFSPLTTPSPVLSDQTSGNSSQQLFTGILGVLTGILDTLNTLINRPASNQSTPETTQTIGQQAESDILLGTALLAAATTFLLFAAVLMQPFITNPTGSTDTPDNNTPPTGNITDNPTSDPTSNPTSEPPTTPPDVTTVTTDPITTNVPPNTVPLLGNLPDIERMAAQAEQERQSPGKSDVIAFLHSDFIDTVNYARTGNDVQVHRFLEGLKATAPNDTKLKNKFQNFFNSLNSNNGTMPVTLKDLNAYLSQNYHMAVYADGDSVNIGRVNAVIDFNNPATNSVTPIYVVDWDYDTGVSGELGRTTTDSNTNELLMVYVNYNGVQRMVDDQMNMFGNDQTIYPIGALGPAYTYNNLLNRALNGISQDQQRNFLLVNTILTTATHEAGHVVSDQSRPNMEEYRGFLTELAYSDTPLLALAGILPFGQNGEPSDSYARQVYQLIINLGERQLGRQLDSSVTNFEEAAKALYNLTPDQLHTLARGLLNERFSPSQTAIAALDNLGSGSIHLALNPVSLITSLQSQVNNSVSYIWNGSKSPETNNTRNLFTQQQGNSGYSGYLQSEPIIFGLGYLKEELEEIETLLD